MAEVPKNNTKISQDLSLYSLNRFYKSCMHIISHQFSFEEMPDKNTLFMTCYDKLNNVFLLTNKHMTSGGHSEINNESEDSRVI